MAALLTNQELALWTGNTLADVDADPFATDVIDKVSQMVCFLGAHDGAQIDPVTLETIPEWTLVAGPGLAPVDVRMVVLQVCKRTYENPRQVVQEGNIGPIGGDRVLDVAAMLMELSEYERATITKYNPAGDPTPADTGVVFILPTTRGSETSMPGSPLYVGDNLQIGLEDSADPREWKIPLFNPGDPGDDLNYPDEA